MHTRGAADISQKAQRSVSRSLCALLLSMLSALCGCEAMGRYAHDRMLDLVDCAKFNVGYGIGLAADLHVTDWFAPGIGYLSYTTNFGWDDRVIHGTWEECVVINTPAYAVEAVIGDAEQRSDTDYNPVAQIRRLALAGVFLANERWIRNGRTRRVTVGHYSLFNFASVSRFLRQTDPGSFFLREGERPNDRRRSFWDRAWIEAGATVGLVQLRAGVNPLQMLDFLAGLVGLDPVGDDRRVVKPTR